MKLSQIPQSALLARWPLNVGPGEWVVLVIVIAAVLYFLAPRNRRHR